MGVLPQRLGRRRAAESPTDGSTPRVAGPTTRHTLEAVLEAIGCPAFVVDCGGHVLLANAVGKEVLDGEGGPLRASLVTTVAAGLSGRVWELMPLAGQDRSPEFLALLKGPADTAGAGEGVLNGNHPKTDQAVVRATRLWKLTRRQGQVLELLACGLTNGLVANMLQIGDRAVEYHVSAILDKAGAANRTMLISKLLDL